MSEVPPGARQSEAGTGAADGELDARVRRADEDRWLAARFAPRGARARLVALYAVNLEVARVAEIVSEPMLGEIRLQWLREALDEIASGGPVRAHDAARALAEAARGADVAALRDELTGVIDARARDLDAAPFATLDDLSAYGVATAGGVMRAALRLLGLDPDDTRLSAVAAPAARAWALTGLARAFGPLAAAGRAPLPDDLRAEAGLDLGDLHGGRRPEEAARALAAVLAAARDAYREASAAARQAPPQAWPAFGYVALVPGYLRRLSRPGRDPYRDAADRLLLTRQLSLVAAAALGRI